MGRSRAAWRRCTVFQPIRTVRGIRSAAPATPSHGLRDKSPSSATAAARWPGTRGAGPGRVSAGWGTTRSPRAGSAQCRGQTVVSGAPPAARWPRSACRTARRKGMRSRRPCSPTRVRSAAPSTASSAHPGGRAPTGRIPSPKGEGVGRWGRQKPQCTANGREQGGDDRQHPEEAARVSRMHALPLVPVRATRGRTLPASYIRTLKLSPPPMRSIRLDPSNETTRRQASLPVESL